MLKIRTRAVTLALAAAVAVTSFTPSFALPMPSVSAAPPAVSGAASSDVQQVQYWRHRGGGYYRGGYGRGYYGGYRGYHGYRHGYRYHDGYWFPLAAFGAGALIGGAIASEPRTYARPAAGINPRHYEWCANRYRSYRGYDNTFQPNHGPRQQCLSPFY
ncbi:MULTISPECIES: BA14K family protein [unclassified Rhizobium]|uniref:BA14K family protein n=1 Tax=unclassified Rhizobium TaxID=2613769 RepID=UPI001ADB7C7A|nr:MULTISPECIES: BA14K family protein [unclassified Rhizobium]MBO9097477.1 BA14K family protein [Rhizobium sp. L58/93]MBO9133671.1 BA14K family protein [Rhizobium sp. B209b/85]MBO9167716.1 BA14K family protein [Rhizobium sp. L245/93]MBO9183675.1 BA14K family protein [Rhizobium sp. E27B/91]QXZ83992.1 BA14K family protein [Rhizobium sp. K1/93]